MLQSSSLGGSRTLLPRGQVLGNHCDQPWLSRGCSGPCGALVMLWEDRYPACMLVGGGNTPPALSLLEPNGHQGFPRMGRELLGSLDKGIHTFTVGSGALVCFSADHHPHCSAMHALGYPSAKAGLPKAKAALRPLQAQPSPSTPTS